MEKVNSGICKIVLFAWMLFCFCFLFSWGVGGGGGGGAEKSELLPIGDQPDRF